jgi:acyl-lipid omega-6 desaturase (Delta-12 desaturase)
MTTTAPQATRRARPAWAEALEPYSRPSWPRAALDVATSVVPYLALSAAMVALLDVSYWLVLALALPTAGFLLRTFILFHDCTHGSFVPSRKWNTRLGVLFGLLVMQPFHTWRHHHVAHHGSAGDLDRRGTGDVPTLTVAEYAARSRGGRLGYWLFRHPLVMFGIGPIYSLVVNPRLVPKGASPRLRASVAWTNVAIVLLLTAVIAAIGWQEYLLTQEPPVFLAGMAGVWLFYVQHQFEDVYWESSDRWSYEAAALRGSSYLKLPQPLQFFTGNIGLHHVHHLNARIPNYNLQRAHDENEIFHSVPVLTIRDGLRSTRLKLWDPEAGRLVTFAEARRSRRRGAGEPAPALGG